VKVPATEVDVSLVSVKVAPGAVDVTVTLPPSAAKPVPVIVNVPVAPWPKLFVAVPWGENAMEVIVPPAAPATVAIAIGNAAAASKAPAASAFTKWRCIRRGLFIVNCSIHKGRLSSL
jgi:hypothetical protein